MRPFAFTAAAFVMLAGTVANAQQTGPAMDPAAGPSVDPAASAPAPEAASSASAEGAGPRQGRWSARIMGGADLPVGGNLHNGATAPVADLGVLNPALAGVPATLNILQRGNQRAYNESLGAGFEVGYGLSDMSEVFGSFRWQRSNAGQILIGTAAVPALNAQLPVFGNFSRLQAYSGEIGYRRYFGTFVKPYLAARAGITFTDPIRVDVLVPDGGIALNSVPFYRSSISATVGGDLGVAFPLSAGVDLNLETGIRYTTKLRGDDSGLDGLGLGAINGAGARFDVPIRAGLTFRF